MAGNQSSTGSSFGGTNNVFSSLSSTTSNPAPSNPFGSLTSTGSTTQSDSSKPLFSFGSTQAQNPVPNSSSTSAPLFSFSAKPEVSKPLFSSASTTSSSTEPPKFSFSTDGGFGSKATESVNNTSSNSLFQNSSTTTSTTSNGSTTSGLFQFNKPSTTAPPAKPLFGAPAPAPTAKTTETPVQSTGISGSDDAKKIKFRALNEKFLEKISTLVKENAYADLTSVVQTYIKFSGQINSNSIQDTDKPTASTANSQLPKENKTSSLFSQSKPSASLFSKPAESTAEKKEDDKPSLFPTSQIPQIKSNTFSFKPSAPKKDEEQKDAISEKPTTSVPEAPKFQFGVTPTSNTTDASEKSNESKENKKDESENKEESKSATPLFSFTPKPADSAPPATFSFSKPAAQNHTWSPEKGIQFATPSSKDDKSNDNSKDEGSTTPAFTPKPFSFGSSTTSSAPFKFGASTSDSSSGFKFTAGTTSTSTNNSSSGGLFGSTNTSTTTTPGLFGGASSANGNGVAKPFSFSFGKKPEETTSTTSEKPDTPSAATPTAETSKEEPKEDGTADGEEEKEASNNSDLTAKGPGEEDEDSLYEKKTKIYQVEGSTPKQMGLGLLRVLKHKTTNKTRVLVRAEPSGRVLLNTLLRSSFKYNANGPSVSVMSVTEEGKPVTYLLRVKTPADASELANILETNK